MLLAMETSGVGCLAISPRFLRKVRLDAELVMVSFAFALYSNLYFPPGNQRQSMKVTIVLLCLTLSVVHILLLIHEPTQVFLFQFFKLNYHSNQNEPTKVWSFLILESSNWSVSPLSTTKIVTLISMSIFITTNNHPQTQAHVCLIFPMINPNNLSNINLHLLIIHKPTQVWSLSPSQSSTWSTLVLNTIPDQH